MRTTVTLDPNVAMSIKKRMAAKKLILQGNLESGLAVRPEGNRKGEKEGAVQGSPAFFRFSAWHRFEPAQPTRAWHGELVFAML
jgi:hypothetical protein